MRLKDKVALITGAGRGIGRDIALAYAREGAQVVINDVDPATAAATAKDVGGLAVVADVAKAADIAGMVDTVIEERGRIDILVNNAMKIVPGKLEAAARSGLGHDHEHRAQRRLPRQPGLRQAHDRAEVRRASSTSPPSPACSPTTGPAPIRW